MQRSKGIVTRSPRLPERGWSWHLGKVAAFDPNPCTVDPDGSLSSAVLRETQPRLWCTRTPRVALGGRVGRDR